MGWIRDHSLQECGGVNSCQDKEMTWPTQEAALMMTCIGCRPESVGTEQRNWKSQQ